MQKMESACTPKKVGIFHILFLLFAGFEISEFSYIMIIYNKFSGKNLSNYSM